MTRSRWLIPLLCLTLSACSTGKGFDRPGIQAALQQRLDVGGERAPSNLAGIAATPTEPFRLGIYFVRREFPTRQSVQTAEWLSTEKDALIRRLSPLRDDRIVHEILVLAEPTVLTLTRQELRQAAMRYGIDRLLLVDGIGAVDRYNNAYSFFYPTIVGAWLAPGTVSDALFVIDSRLWDVRTDAFGERHMAEGQAHTVGTAVLVEDADTLREAKRRAIEAFGAALVEHLRSPAGAGSGAPSPQR